jgi:sugar phosphate isomerase/epimerase
MNNRVIDQSLLRQDRRSFLRSAAGFAAVVGVGTSSAAVIAPTPSARPTIRLGIASYTFRTMTRSQLIAVLKKLRVATVNLKDVKDHLPSTSPADEDAAIADYVSAGIEITGVGTITFNKDEDNDVRQKFEYAKRAGVKVIVAGNPPIAVLPRIERFVREYDIRIAIHNHGPEDKLWPSPLTVLHAVQHMDSRMGCCIDVGHTMRSGMDVVSAIQKAGPRLFDVHMKDLAVPDAKESQVAVGEGVMPVARIFQTLQKIGYPGQVDLEYEINPEDPTPGVVESIAYMRGVIAGMEPDAG